MMLKTDEADINIKNLNSIDKILYLQVYCVHFILIYLIPINKI
jgi:hypothetical protein